MTTNPIEPALAPPAATKPGAVLALPLGAVQTVGRSRVADAPPALKHELRATFWAGIAIIVLFFGIGGIWAATAPLAGATIAPGVVSPEGSRRTVQHLEGGIIRDIRVKEGDKVKAGETLVELSGVSAQAEVGQLTTRLRTLAATEARLKAEQSGAKAPVFDHPSLADRNDPEVAAIIAQQSHEFRTREAADRNRVEILTQRIAQLKEQNVGTDRQITSIRRQLALIREEIVAKKELLEKGYETKPRLLALQRNEAELSGNEGELLARIARNDEAIGETKLQITNTQVQRKEDIDRDLADTQGKRIELESQLAASLDKLKRTDIVAPVDGTVIDLHFKTKGGVVRPGEPILDIVPDHETLVIDARIQPRDIDDVHAKGSAYVTFPSYPQRRMLRVPAAVERVSADTLSDQRTGERYYTAKVVVDASALKDLDPFVDLMPGMPAEVYISTTQRTFLRYLLQPFLFAVERSFRED
jgi:HlyD family secretion protein